MIIIYTIAFFILPGEQSVIIQKSNYFVSMHLCTSPLCCRNFKLLVLLLVLSTKMSQKDLILHLFLEGNDPTLG